jgi:heat shock protein HtpX
MWFSRYREYKADAGSAKYVGKEKMLAALRALQKIQSEWKINTQFATMQISSPKQSSWKSLYSSHPTLEKRITALETLIIK